MTNALDQVPLGAGQRLEILDLSKFAQPAKRAAVRQNRWPIVRNNDFRELAVLVMPVHVNAAPASLSYSFNRTTRRTDVITFVPFSTLPKPAPTLDRSLRRWDLVAVVLNVA